MDVIDLSNATRGEAAKAVALIFSWDLGKYKKVSALVTSVIRTGVRDKIILVIKEEKTWKIAFSLCGVTWPRGKEPYADEAFELLRQTILHTKVEVLLDTVDQDGYFIGTLLASNTHVAIPLLEVGLAKMEGDYPKAYNTEFNNAQKSAKSKKLKIWETYVETSQNIQLVTEKRAEGHPRTCKSVKKKQRSMYMEEISSKCKEQIQFHVS